MTTKNPRVNVTFNADDLELIKALAEKNHLSMAAMIEKMAKDWMEDYEDFVLAVRAEEAEKRWEEEGRPIITHEELCRKLGITSNMTPKSTKKS